MAVERKSFYSLNFYEYGEAFFGSDRKLRYRLALEPLSNVHWTPPDKRGELHLKASVWPGPYNYTKTPQEQKKEELFEFTKDGLEEAVAWIQELCGQQAE